MSTGEAAIPIFSPDPSVAPSESSSSKPPPTLLVKMEDFD